MSRTIKFRAWDNGQMEYSKPMPDFGFWKWSGYSSSTVLMQFTGLKDKTGMEIYEGDVVNRYGGGLLGNPAEVLSSGEVVFTSFGYKIKVVEYDKSLGRDVEEHHNMYNQSELEVIGNIYENPDGLQEDERHHRVLQEGAKKGWATRRKDTNGR